MDDRDHLRTFADYAICAGYFLGAFALTLSALYATIRWAGALFHGDPITPWMWAVAGVVMLPVAIVILGLGAVAGLYIAAERLQDHDCGTCGKTGAWTHRNSLGHHICESCFQGYGLLEVPPWYQGTVREVRL